MPAKSLGVWRLAWKEKVKKRTKDLEEEFNHGKMMTTCADNGHWLVESTVPFG